MRWAATVGAKVARKSHCCVVPLGTRESQHFQLSTSGAISPQLERTEFSRVGNEHVECGCRVRLKICDTQVSRVEIPADAEDSELLVEMAGLEKIVNVLHSGSSKGAFAAIMLRFSRLHQNWLGNEGEANGRNVATTGGDDWLGLALQGRIRHWLCHALNGVHQSAKGAKVMPNFKSAAYRRRMLGHLSAAAVAAAITVSPSQALQDLSAAPAGKAMQEHPAQWAQASKAEQQPAPSEPSANPEPQPAPPPPPVPSANGPATAPARIDETDKEKEGTPATVVDGQQLESILGKNVLSPIGENTGRIVDIVVDHTGQLRAAIIDFGGFLGVGTRKIAIDWRMIRFPSDSKKGDVVVDLTRDQLRIAPIFTPGEPVVILGRPEATP